MSRAVIYARVSRADKHGSTTSVDDQVRELREALSHAGIREVHAPLEDRALSGSKANVRRPRWEELRALVASDSVDVVALWETSRSTRRMSVWIEFRDLCAEHGVKWFVRDHLVDPAGLSDRLTGTILAAVAENESGQTAERVRRGIRAKAAQGMPHGKEIYGYRRVYDDATGELSHVDILPYESNIIRWLVDSALAGRALRSLATELNDRGVAAPSDAIAARKHRAPTGATWTGRTIKQILVSPTYTGIRRHKPTPKYGKKITEAPADHTAAWEAIVTEDEHVRLIALLTDPARNNRAGASAGVVHFLSGVLRCNKCNGPMRADRTVRAGKTQEYYICGSSRCRGSSVRRTDAEDLISALVVARLSRTDAGPVHAPDTSPETDARAILDTAEARLNELADAFASGALSLTAYGAAEKRLQAQVDDARKALADAVVPILPADFDTSRPQAAWDSASPETRQAVCRALFSTIVVGPTPRGRLPFDPNRIQPEWR